MIEFFLWFISNILMLILYSPLILIFMVIALFVWSAFTYKDR